MKIKDKRFKITALYERLSKDDEVQGEYQSDWRKGLLRSRNE